MRYFWQVTDSAAPTPLKDVETLQRHAFSFESVQIIPNLLAMHWIHWSGHVYVERTLRNRTCLSVKDTATDVFGYFSLTSDPPQVQSWATKQSPKLLHFGRANKS